MNRVTLLAGLLACSLLCGCTALEKKQQAGAAVELNGQYLYRSTLDSLTLGLSSEDSLRVCQHYISQWAKDLLMEEKGEWRMATGNRDQIERMVSDYRRTLYVQAYEEWLVERRMPKGVPDSTVTGVYEQMPDRFRLEESIVRGLLVVVPTDAPKVAHLKSWMAKVSLDEIEKYAYQNATGYELFTDRWLTTTELLPHIPLEREAIETALKSKNQIEVSDSLKTFILQVTDKHLRGTAMPIEYARPEIVKMVLNERQVDFLNKERERLYNEAIQEQKIRFYE